MTKWYLDCTTPCGELCIVYWGRVQIAGLAMTYASVLEVGRGGERRERRTLLGGAEPQVHADRVGVEISRLGVRGRWMAEADAIDVDLLRTEQGRVRWGCVAPRAEVEVVVGDSTYLGEGYVERMEMTVAPWRLPIDVLRWGRVIAGETNVVWIRWEGSRPRTDAWVNGTLDPAAVIEDGEVRAGGVRVAMGEGEGGHGGARRVVRSGAIGATALRDIPGLSAVVPAPLLEAREEKWVSRAVVSGEIGGRVVRREGWAVHERVEFAARGRAGGERAELAMESGARG